MLLRLFKRGKAAHQRIAVLLLGKETNFEIIRGGGMMAEKFILAHDLGTTGNKASLFDEQGNVRASSLSTYGTEYPRPHWVEQNPEDWWNAVCTSTKQLL